MIFGHILLFLFAVRMKTLSYVNKFVDNFRYDLDENNCLIAQIVRKGLVIYIYI